MILIGLSAHYADHQLQLNRDYHDAVVKSGGTPIILPLLTDSVRLGSLADQLDGLILTGGFDINPLYFGEEPAAKLGDVSPERDSFELAFLNEFYPTGKPILAICRGLQVLNVFLGGTLYQDLPNQYPDSIQHSQKAPRHHCAHSVLLKPNSILAKSFQQEKIFVNTYHHQSIKKIASSLEQIGNATDGVIEAVESSDKKRYLVGVQWHPEGMFDTDDNSRKLFQQFISVCQSQKDTINV
ncbi:gamma-glutamyl-gamma-aminobutyrate hydrolase family protein [Risungbinella massiliensis]|uniref:gamma-glutamyl-gamma-aminobutyrate hydrolase family protein n=1 Tax=Risungbinella massiliensis TaxID=1329796 RepID=UPI0005CBD620|nr:gamma-glutamyl-gamma-aminobutyrate hydrolase family protein [Risungbinella massiliensis]